MKISANDVRVGNVIFHDNKYLIVSKTIHTQPGKGGAYIQIETKDIKTGTKINHRFRSSEDIEKIRLDQSTYQFLYEEGNNLVLMDAETYEQKFVPKTLLGEQISFLKEGMNVMLELHDNEPLVASLSSTPEVTVKECESVVKGQTSTSSYKPAILENGVRIMVPPFIKEGDKIVVDKRIKIFRKDSNKKLKLVYSIIMSMQNMGDNLPLHHHCKYTFHFAVIAISLQGNVE